MQIFDLDKLKTFHVVGNLKNISMAAEKLNLSQSSVSRQILYLENFFHKKLFHRCGKYLQITKQGEILFEYTTEILRSAKTAQSLICDDDKEVKGSLKIAATVGMTSLYLAPLLKGFLDLYPEIKLTIIASDKEPKLKLEEADIAIRPFIKEETDFIQKLLFTTHASLYASPEYLKKFGTPQTPEDLDKHRLIAFGNHANHPFPQMDWHLKLGMPKGQVRESYIEVNLAQNRCDLAIAGVGIASISKEHPDLKKTNLVEVLPHIIGPEITAYYTYQPELQNSKRVILLYDYLKRYLNLKSA